MMFAKVLRLFAALFLLLSAVIGLLLVWPQLLALEKLPVVSMLISPRALWVLITGIALVICLIAAIAAKTARKFLLSFSAIMLVFILTQLAVLSSQGYQNPASIEAKDWNSSNETSETGLTLPENSTQLKVLTWNTLGSERVISPLVTLAIEEQLEIIALPETTRATALAIQAELARAQIFMSLFSVDNNSANPVESTSLLVLDGLGEFKQSDDELTALLPSVLVQNTEPKQAKVSGLNVVAVHTIPPLPNFNAYWSTDLDQLEEFCNLENSILIGDFNATADHFYSYSTKSNSSCQDAAVSLSAAAVGSWPSSLPTLLGVNIDRVRFSSDWRALSYQVLSDFDSYGSDHRPVLVTLGKKLKS